MIDHLSSGFAGLPGDLQVLSSVPQRRFFTAQGVLEKGAAPVSCAKFWSQPPHLVGSRQMVDLTATPLKPHETALADRSGGRVGAPKRTLTKIFVQWFPRLRGSRSGFEKRGLDLASRRADNGPPPTRGSGAAAGNTPLTCGVAVEILWRVCDSGAFSRVSLRPGSWLVVSVGGVLSGGGYRGC